MTPEAFRKLALSFPGASEEAHFERASFRVGTRIFATLDPDGTEAMVMVKPVERCLLLIEADPDTFFAYGGWTTRSGALGVRLDRVNEALLRELVGEAWERLAAPGAHAPKRRPARKETAQRERGKPGLEKPAQKKRTPKRGTPKKRTPKKSGKVSR